MKSSPGQGTRAMQLLAPLEFGWRMKAFESAETRLRHLPDRRLELCIVHDVISGVTPLMLAWWFRHIGGQMEYQGRTVSRYRVWHPNDHIHWALARPGPDGGASPGAVFRIVEAFNRDPRYRIDVLETVEKLDETGIRLSNRLGGFEISNLEHTFTAVRGGTLYRSRMLIGAAHPLVQPWFNAIIRPRVFPEDMARAWLRHNIEEVGNFEFFLPALYAAAHAGNHEFITEAHSASSPNSQTAGDELEPPHKPDFRTRPTILHAQGGPK